jgi:hypothetical protein
LDQKKRWRWGRSSYVTLEERIGEKYCPEKFDKFKKEKR